MGMLEKVLLALLLGALAAFPVGLILYMRTAYREGGRAAVKTALGVFGLALVLWLGPPLWAEHMIDLVRRLLTHPFETTTIILVIVSWLLHRTVVRWAKERFDHN